MVVKVVMLEVVGWLPRTGFAAAPGPGCGGILPSCGHPPHGAHTSQLVAHLDRTSIDDPPSRTKSTREKGWLAGPPTSTDGDEGTPLGTTTTPPTSSAAGARDAANDDDTAAGPPTSTDGDEGTPLGTTTTPPTSSAAGARDAANDDDTAVLQFSVGTVLQFLTFSAI
ncbi:UNVERIFIED_CONTAM: hypothetical protein FKN15_015186 [Acipenser sinensis]